MLPKIICVLLVFQLLNVAGYREEEQENGAEDNYGIYNEDYNIESDRRHRHEPKKTVKTLSPKEVEEVRGAIKQILSGHKQYSSYSPLSSNEKYEKRSLRDKQIHDPLTVEPLHENGSIRTKINHFPDRDETKSETSTKTTDETESDISSIKDEDPSDDNHESETNNPILARSSLLIESSVDISPRVDETATQESYQTETNEEIIGATQAIPTRSLPGVLSIDDTLSNIDESSSKDDYQTETNEELIGATEAIPTRSSPSISLTFDDISTNTNENTKEAYQSEVNEDLIGLGLKIDNTLSTTDEISTMENYQIGANNELGIKTGNEATMTMARTANPITTTSEPTTPMTTTTKKRTTTKFQLDVPALLEIIANLTYDYEMNLTDNLNETLLKLSIPTCETPTTTEQAGAFIDYDANATGTIVAKCFVCGLEEESIPRHAQCADAFAGDFLPLVPVDMTARGRISKYRKYCRYLDVNHYLVNSTMPRSVYGRWTGGCSVRWIDLSGIYTQRSCRNRNRAIMGRHFASKRMAKLEMALSNLKDGCISSPMATLVPLSRGISLYARFHACVCTGSWCNAAAERTDWLWLVPLLAYTSLDLIQLSVI